MAFSKKDWALWKRSFVDWSEGPMGLYVDRQWVGPRYDDWDLHRPWRPIVWEDHERRVLRYLFTTNSRGRWPHHTVYWIDKGKSAKTLKLAGVAQWMAMFHERKAELFLVANSKDQVKGRAYLTLVESIENNPHIHGHVEVLEKDIKILKTGNVIRPLPKNAGSVAGGNQIFLGIDEWWDWEGDEDEEAGAELKRTPTRRMSYRMISSYPPFIGVKGPMNRLLDAFFDSEDRPRKNLERVEGLEDLPLYITPNGSAIWWDQEHRHRWHTPEFLAETRDDPTLRENHFYRIWFARRVAPSDTFIESQMWDACEDPDWNPVGLSRRMPCVMGVDLAYKNDASAAILRTYDPLTGRYTLLDHKIWEPGMYAPEHRDRLLLDVKTWIMDRVRAHEVLAIYIDPSQAAHISAELKLQGVNVIEVQQIGVREKADTDYWAHITSRRLRNYPQSQDLRQHALHAVARETGKGNWRIDKRKTTVHIDGAVADSMCCLAVTEYRDQLERKMKRRWRPAAPVAYQGFEGRLRRALGHGR